jgi:hypothetical protein
MSVLVLVLLGFCGVGGPASGSSAPVSFPYEYVPPEVPSTVGAQGIQGTIPGLPVGPPPGIAVGPISPVGPSPDPSAGPFQRIAVRSEYQIWNGSLSPSIAVPSVGALVSLQNVTDGWYANGTTNVDGFVNLSVWAGWYDVSVTQPSGVVNLSEQENIDASSLWVRWLLPTDLTSTTVDNCGPTQGTCTKTLYAHVSGFWQLPGLPQWTVNLLNASDGDAVLASAITGSNGSATFSRVDSAYTYEVTTDGYAQAATGVVWNCANDSEGPFAGATLVNANAFAARDTRYSGLLIGTPPPPAGLEWALSADTTLTGGTLFLGEHWHPTNFTLTLRNVRVYADADQSDPTSAGLAFSNCTIVFLAQSALFSILGPAYLFLNQSTVLGSAVPSHSTSQLELLVTSATGTLVDLTNVTLANPAVISGDWSGDRLVWNGTTVRSNSAVFFTAVTVTRSEIWGMFSLGEIGNWSESWDRDSFIDDRAGLTDSQSGGSPGGNLSITNSTSTNSTIFSNANVTTLWGDDLQTSYSEAQTLAGFSGVSGTVDRSRLTFGIALGQNYTQLYLSLRKGGPNSGPFPGYACGFRLPDGTNVSQSYWNDSGFPMVNVSVGAFSDVALNVFDSVWNITRTPAQLIANYTVAGQTILEGGGMGMESATNGLYVNYSVLNTSNGFWAGAQATFDHDLWPWTIVYNGYSDGVQMFYVPDAAHPSLNRVYEFENDSWTNEVFNRTVWGDAVTGASWFWPEAQELVQDTQDNQFGGPHGGEIVFAHNTVDPILAGAGQVAPMDLELSQSGVNATVASNLFRNSPAYVHGPFFAHPYAADIQAEGGTVTVTRNWFLNLNNESVAVAATNLQGHADGSHPVLRLSDNHYSYAPAEGQPFVDPTGPYEASESPRTPVDFLGIPAESTVDYELPIGENVSGPQTDGDPYIFNTTVLQADPTYDTGHSQLWPASWSWAIAPSVNVTSGAPVVSFAGEGGPQPAFLWDGFSYRLAVEPTAVEIGVNSSSAPPITVEFALPPGSNASVEGVDPASGVEFLTETLHASAYGTVTVPYVPSDDPLEAVFEVEAAPGSPGVAPTPSLASELSAFGPAVVPAVALVAAVWFVRRTRPGGGSPNGPTVKPKSS